MSKTYFFYDLETSGFSPRRDRIMQFAGIRTDENFNPIKGAEYNCLIYLADDILPSPTAIMVTKITPQKTREEGYSEADFAKLFINEINTPDTVFVGYNNIRFDDEHMRHFLWRNFYDPYEWAWKNGNSRWDLLDVVRFVRALRPDGIKWPRITIETGEKIPSNKLELLSELNGFPHRHAHDALSDVEDTINLAKLLNEKQPKMFNFLLQNRGKNEIGKIVNSGQPFVYSSGRFPMENKKSSVVIKISDLKNSSILVYDLREDIENFAKITEEETLEKLTASWEERRKSDFKNLPIKELVLNKCPTVSPIGTLDSESQKRINLDIETIKDNLSKLNKNHGIVDKMISAYFNYSEKRRENNNNSFSNRDVEDKLYDSFVPPSDKAKISAVASADKNDLADFNPDFTDERLPELLLRYKARNFAKSMNESEKNKYEKWRIKKLSNEMPRYFREISFLEFFAKNPDENAINKFVEKMPENEKKEFFTIKDFADNFAKLGNKIDESVLVDLRLWAESIAPYDNGDSDDFAE